MCFFKGSFFSVLDSESDDSLLLTAEEDLKVFKIVKYDNTAKNFISFYYNYTYNKGKTYNSRIYGRCGIISEGLHSYAPTVKMADYKICVKLYNDVLPSGHRFYYEVYQKGRTDCTLYRMDCIIPKGAKYLFNHKGECVSDTLKVLKFTKIG